MAEWGGQQAGDVSRSDISQFPGLNPERQADEKKEEGEKGRGRLGSTASTFVSGELLLHPTFPFLLL